jgi:hypothetical protein
MSNINFGKYKGRSFGTLPYDYLEWMVQKDTYQAKEAKAELERRIDYGSAPKEIMQEKYGKPDAAVPPLPAEPTSFRDFEPRSPEVSIRAIDEASLLLHDTWRKANTGIATWIGDMFIAALEQGELTSSKDGNFVLLHAQIHFTFHTLDKTHTLITIQPTKEYYSCP